MSELSPTLRDNLHTAMSLELATMPTYLYAYWSVRPLDDGGSQAAVNAAETLLSVVYEEMLHFGLVSNVLNSLGGTPAVNDRRYIPVYPGPLPAHSKTENPFVVSLQRLSLNAVGIFLDIELPMSADPEPPTTEGWATIGQFYKAIELELTSDLDYSHGRQLPVGDNPGAGTLIQVSSRETALKALEEIVEQGEGLSDTIHTDGDHELAHYWKFLDIQTAIEKGAVDVATDVYPVINNPSAAGYTSDQQHANMLFNSAYSNLLDALQTTLSSDAPGIFGAPTRFMNQLGHLAAVLRNTGTVPGTDSVPGPTFEYVPPDERATS